MNTKISKLIGFLAIFGLFSALLVFAASAADLPIDTAAATSKSLPAGLFQFNNLEISAVPSAEEPPANIDAIQYNDKSCVVYVNGKSNQPIPCIFNGNQDNSFTILVDEKTILLSANQESALLNDFTAGDKINVLGWLSADSKTIRAASITDLESKNFHRSLSGTIKNVTADGFTLVLSDGTEVAVKTPIIEGAKITIKGVFDKINNAVSDVLSILVAPAAAPEVAPAPTPAQEQVTPKRPSTLFRNFLKVFGL